MNWQNRSYCGDLSDTHADQQPGQEVSLYGWVDTSRDHGHLLFIHLRDISGVVQLVFDSERNTDSYTLAQQLRTEYVVAIQGVVEKRSDETINPHIPTGSIEVLVQDLQILNASETPPFLITEKDLFEGTDNQFNVDEDIRLRYRYLDLRRTSMQQNMIQRSKLTKTIRDYLDEKGFLELETPVLTKSTPEGARDYLVPSRTHDHKFYALPQSPQLFKQLFMMGGLERYFQIVRCFRDEDLRPNRQPEFTQVDLEASFIDEDFIYDCLEGLMTRLCDSQGISLTTPFPKITYDDAISLYGTDCPDLRFGMTFVDISEDVKDCHYKIFQMILGKGGIIKGFNLKGQADQLSKNVLQNEFAMKLIPKMGGKGMTWMKVIDGKLESNIVQFFSEAEQAAIIQKCQGEDGDVLFFVADTDHRLVHDILGQFRVFIADRQGLVPENTYAPCWIVDFPLFEKKDGRLHALHHPFTQPQIDIKGLSQEALLETKSRAYDLVMNGEELGGGSIRIHDPEMQKTVFQALNLTEDEIASKFGFFVQALSYGTPPHGGLALGLDRLVAMLLNQESIREVIAFPKNRAAYCPLTQAPSDVSEEQLRDLQLALKPVLQK